MELNLVIAVIIFFASIILCYRYKRNGNIGRITILLIGLFITIIALIYPIYDDAENAFQRIVFSILYAVQCIYVGQDFELIQTKLVTHSLSKAYYFAVYLCFLLAPIFTTGMIFTLIEGAMHKLEYKISLFTSDKKTLHIFSNINKEAITMAEGLDGKSSIIIFCNEKDKEIKENYKAIIKKINAIVIPQNEFNVDIKKKNVRFYEISDNEIQNTDNGMKLIEKYQDNEKVKVIIFSTRKETEMLIDSEKRKVNVELINKNKYALYNLLEQRPVIKWSKNNKISALVIGEERRALEIVKILFWALQLDGYDLEINVVGDNASHIKEMFYHQCPGLNEEKYNINFYNADIQTREFDEVLNTKCQETNYIILAEDDDNLNIETAIFLREYYLFADKESYSNKPAINVWLNDEIKGIDKLGLNDNNYAKKKNDGNKVLYELYPFGTTEQIYSQVTIFSEKLKNLALMMHLANVGALDKTKEAEEIATQTFVNREKTRKYSIASAIHMKYSLYTKGVDLFAQEITPEIIEQVRKIVYDENEIHSLMISYARMWNVFWRADGYRRVSFEEAAVYYKKGVTRTQQHEMARLNPCLTDLDEFADNEIKMTELYGRTVTLVSVDKDYIQHFPVILQKLINKN